MRPWLTSVLCMDAWMIDECMYGTCRWVNACMNDGCVRGWSDIRVECMHVHGWWIDGFAVNGLILKMVNAGLMDA